MVFFSLWSWELCFKVCHRYQALFSLASATSSKLACRECSMNASNHLPPPQGVSKWLHPSRRNSKAGILWPSRGASARRCHASWLTLPWLKSDQYRLKLLNHPTNHWTWARHDEPGSIPQGVLGHRGAPVFWTGRGISSKTTMPKRAQGHHPVATSTTNLRRSFFATVCCMPGTAWLRGRLLKRSVIALSYSVGKWWQWKVWCVEWLMWNVAI